MGPLYARNARAGSRGILGQGLCSRRSRKAFDLGNEEALLGRRAAASESQRVRPVLHEESVGPNTGNEIVLATHPTRASGSKRRELRADNSVSSAKSCEPVSATT